MAEFVEVSLLGAVGVEQVVNVFWYRNETNFGTDTARNTAAQELASDHNVTLFPALAACVQTPYTQFAATYQYYDSGGVIRASARFTFPAVHNGFSGVVARDGNGHVAILRAALGSGADLATPVKQPIRGYIAVGPLNNDQVAQDGSIILTPGLAFEQLAVAAAETISIASASFPFAPIRVHRTIAAGQPTKLNGYRNVNAFVIRSRGSWRRSRNNAR